VLSRLTHSVGDGTGDLSDAVWSYQRYNPHGFAASPNAYAD